MLLQQIVFFLLLLLTQFTNTISLVTVTKTRKYYHAYHNSNSIFKLSAVLTEYLEDLQSLSTVRFVVIGNGAILETVGSFSNLRYSETTKGKLATVSTENPCFECHLRINKIAKVKNVIVTKFDKKLFISRFLSGDDTTLLSVILHEPTERTISNW